MAELLTIEELANYLRVNTRTVYRLVESDEVPALKIGRQWRFDKSNIAEWLQRKSVGRSANVLVVDDEAAIRDLFVAALAERKCKIDTAKNGHEGLKFFKERDYALVFLDLRLPLVNGVELLREIRASKPVLPVMIITGYPDSELMSEALEFGPLGLMKKPLSVSEIISVYDVVFSGAAGAQIRK